jgi:membrane-associated phospholipid phosphatase
MRRLLIGVLWLAAIAAAFALDRPVAEYIAQRPFGYSFDLYSMFRLAGFLPLWIVVSAAFILIDSERGWRRAWRRGGLLLAAVMASGACAELLKLLVRRERPGDMASYVFRPWTDSPFASGGLGWPSSHTAVAFAAAWVLCRLYPRAAVIWMAMAAACAFSRLLNNAHFVSDLVCAALLAYVVVAVLWRNADRVLPA